MVNLEGKMISTVSGKQYMITEPAGDGAEGVVYNEQSGNFLIKLYKKGNPIQNAKKLQKLQWLIRQHYPDQFIKPLDIVEKPYIGYVMQKVKNHSSLNRLLIPSRDVSFTEWYNRQTGGLRRRFFLAYQIALQFSLLHESNRAYCDISGNNILVNEDPSKASVCMIDIDNIYIPGGDAGNVLGTSRYMAPEIMNRQMEPDIFTDDWSLALILFELLRAGHPFVGKMVEDGTPEMENQAYLGLYPYVDALDTDINRATQMLPAEAVFTKKLKKLFEKTFVKGLENRMERTPALDFALACLEASNNVMKCPECGNWHIARRLGEKYPCPWCDAVNEPPVFLRFKDMYVADLPGSLVEGERIRKSKLVYEFALRKEVNNVTGNYVSDLYVKRDVFSKPVNQYFTVRMAKNGHYYLFNDENNELYLQRKSDDSWIPVRKEKCPLQIDKGDRLYFEDRANLNKKVIDGSRNKYRGLLFRYAVMK